MELNEILNALKKRVNVSVDAGITKERARQIWKSFNNKNKREVLEMAGVSDATAHKSYQIGALSAGLAISIAKVAGINPAYITAQSDSKGKFSKATLNSFLEANGYGYLTAKNTAYAEKPQNEPVIEEPEVYSSDDVSPCAAEGCPCRNVTEDELDVPEGESIDLDEEELILLLRALSTRARWNLSAREKLMQVIKLLL